MTGRRHKDLTGQVFGVLTALELDRIDDGGNAVWKCLCSNCNETSLVRLSALKSMRKSCTHCKMQYREYPRIELACNACGKPVVVPSNRYSVSCDSKCRAIYLGRKSAEFRKASVENTLKQLAVQVKSRAKRKDITCDIDAEFLLTLLERQEGKCAGTGRELLPSMYTAEKHRSDKDTVSVDRIDSNLGYTRDNIQLVGFHYNTAKNSFSDEEFINLCRDVVLNADKKNQQGGP